MALSNLLVAYTGTESADAALGAAILMAEKYDAHLTGLHAHRPRLEGVDPSVWVPASLRGTLDRLESEGSATLEARFHARVGTRIPPDRAHWIARPGIPDRTVADYAQMFDLVLVGRHDAVHAAGAGDLHPDRIAVASGRPVLTIPRGWATERIDDHALIAWDGHRAATRALADAMQILETKRLVTILRVTGRVLADPLPGIDVETALARHGVRTESVTVDPDGRSIGETILAECAARGAELLVMGAYQRGVFREQLMGGTTRTVLERARVPILLSH